MTALVDVSVRSDTGAVRRVNEDSFLVQDPVFAVADGVGGHARGDLASRTALECLARTLPLGSRPTPDEVVAAVSEANAAVRALSSADEQGAAVAGTTLAAVVRARIPGPAGQQCAGEQWLVVHVGDSRVYSWGGGSRDGGGLRQLTSDHSAVQELLDAGLITAEQAAVHPERNVITRALGAEDFVDADVGLVPEADAQTFVICSDGLTRELGDEQIAAILSGGSEDSGGKDLAGRLVDAAVAAGGHDNVTVIVVTTARR